VDDGDETISVETDESVQLGQQVTVRGQRRADRVEADELF
jgi:replication factor A1